MLTVDDQSCSFCADYALDAIMSPADDSTSVRPVHVVDCQPWRLVVNFFNVRPVLPSSSSAWTVGKLPHHRFDVKWISVDLTMELCHFSLINVCWLGQFLNAENNILSSIHLMSKQKSFWGFFLSKLGCGIPLTFIIIQGESVRQRWKLSLGRTRWIFSIFKTLYLNGKQSPCPSDMHRINGYLFHLGKREDTCWKMSPPQIEITKKKVVWTHVSPSFSSVKKNNKVFFFVIKKEVKSWFHVEYHQFWAQRFDSNKVWPQMKYKEFIFKSPLISTNFSISPWHFLLQFYLWCSMQSLVLRTVKHSR